MSLQEDNIFIYNDNWDKIFLAPELFLSDFNYKLNATEQGFGIFTFPLFSKKFCNLLINKLKNLIIGQLIDMKVIQQMMY